MKMNLDIINEAKKQVRTAQTALYNQYKSYWYTICLRYHSNSFDASDSLQNAMIQIFTKLNQFDPAKGDFKHWSAKIVVNENLQMLRKKSNTFNFEIIDDLLIDQAEPLEDESDLTAEKITKLVQKLPDGYRAVFNLYVIEGYSHKEIAEILEISVGTSKSQLFKARKLLKEAMVIMA